MRFGQGYGRWLGGMGFEGFGGGGPRHGMRHGHPGGRRRQFEGSELKLLLLGLIAEGPRHGYDLIRDIEERTGGGYAPSPGVVYPTLTLLDEMGLIQEVKEEGARKRFAITDAGRAHLAEQKATVDAIIERLGAIGAREKRGDSAPIRRAMMGLMMALREAAVGSDDNPDRAHDIAAILDEAARKMERLQR
jgi:DNA-binding PadR family transcriptional regulator